MDDTQLIEIQRLCRMVHERGLRELNISRPDFAISLKAMKRGARAKAQAAPADMLSPTPVELAPVEEGYVVASPLVGIFYRTPSPDSPPFVEIGDTVEIGQTIGIVEAMKVFNEITADCPGMVTAIPAANGKLVQVGQPLVVIAPLE